MRTGTSGCRAKISEDGPVRRSSAISQHSAASTASAGRSTSMLGIARNEARNSTGWCVGPLVPTPMELWLNTNSTGRPIMAAMRIEARM